MQNKLTSLAVILLTTVALAPVGVSAQNAPAAPDKKAVVAAPVQPTQKPAVATKAEAKPAAVNKAEAKPEKKTVVPSKVEVKPVMTADAVQAENRRRLEEELKNTTISGQSIVDFPNRASLGNLELAPLPGINDSAIRGPLPMAASVSGKDLPSEQLLGRMLWCTNPVTASAMLFHFQISCSAMWSFSLNRSCCNIFSYGALHFLGNVMRITDPLGCVSSSWNM